MGVGRGRLEGLVSADNKNHAQAHTLRASHARTHVPQHDSQSAQVLGALDARERVLFADRLRRLERQVLPGATGKLAWASPPHVLEFYCREAGK